MPLERFYLTVPDILDLAINDLKQGGVRAGSQILGGQMGEKSLIFRHIQGIHLWLGTEVPGQRQEQLTQT